MLCNYFTRSLTATAMSAQGQRPAGLEDCLELLRGPTDERRCDLCAMIIHRDVLVHAPLQEDSRDVPICRFVGLLLVTKLLSSEDVAVIRSVYDAVGSHFINRLLLPLGRQQVSTCSKFAGLPGCACSLCPSSAGIPFRTPSYSRCAQSGNH